MIGEEGYDLEDCYQQYNCTSSAKSAHSPLANASQRLFSLKFFLSRNNVLYF
jgi:hypothetical protein